MGEDITLTTEQVRRLDRIAIEEYGIPGAVLMENAGRGAADIAIQMLGRKRGRVLVLCGRGNNGGDGFVIARHLHNRGIAVALWLAARADEVKPESDAGINLRIVQKMKLPLIEGSDAARAKPIAGSRYGLLVDALLGTGLSGEVREPMRTLIQQMNASGIPVLAVDTPSGLDTETGRVLGVAVRARRTATFAAAKRGFFLGEGPAHVGKLHVVDIGVPRELLLRVREQA